MEELRAQAEESKRAKEQDKIRDEKEILSHYQNYAIGGEDN